VKRTGEFQVAEGGADLLHDPVLVRTVLGYIASGEERLAIETASSDSLAAVWDRFWKRRDATPNTASNEALDRFLERVSQATNRFGGVVPGWKSDRGRILIQHGNPDRTERTFDPTTRIETEVWYYDQRSVSYVFQDPQGFGNYKLTGGQ
jgi:GWxTD domain-containing protein